MAFPMRHTCRQGGYIRAQAEGLQGPALTAQHSQTCSSSRCPATAHGSASPHRPSPREPAGPGTLLPGRAEQGWRASPAKGAEGAARSGLGPAGPRQPAKRALQRLAVTSQQHLQGIAMRRLQQARGLPKVLVGAAQLQVRLLLGRVGQRGQ